MRASLGLVLDANILIRAVLGSRVRRLIVGMNKVTLMTPEVCFADAERYLPQILSSRDIPSVEVMPVLDELRQIVLPVNEDLFSAWKNEAIARIGKRDMHDWPILALALTMNCPIWTEDKDFFGTGVATWTSDTVDRYLEETD